MGSTSFLASSRGRTQRANFAINMESAGKQATVIARSIGDLVGTIGDTLGGAQPASVRELLDSLGLAAVPLPSLAKARTCGTPACDCPSPDLGEIRRVIERPDRIEIAVRLRNRTSRPREYTLEAGEIETAEGQKAGALVVAPAVVKLEAGEVTVVRVAVDASKFETHADYGGTIKVSAEKCEPMRLGVVVRIEPEVAVVPVVDLHCCCTPKLRPLRWYHHYYCDPAPERQPDDRQPRPPQG